VPTSRVLPHNVILSEPIKVEVMEKHPMGENSRMCFTETYVEGLVLKIKALSFSVSRTFQFFLENASKMRGAISLGLCPRSHTESQKFVFVLVPTKMVAEA
jgi:hypothetical protein